MKSKIKIYQIINLIKYHQKNKLKCQEVHWMLVVIKGK